MQGSNAAAGLSHGSLTLYVFCFTVILNILSLVHTVPLESFGIFRCVYVGCLSLFLKLRTN